MNKHMKINVFACQLTRAGMGLASVALVAMMMVIVVDVAMRHTLNTPLPGVYDMVSVLLLIMVFSGMAQVVLSQSEILIDLLDTILSGRIVKILRILAAFLTAGLSVYLLVAMVGPARSAYQYGDRLLELGLPVWILWIVAFVGVAVVAMAGWVRFTAELGSPGAAQPGDKDTDDNGSNT